jgi:CubicO group peptidase (beta-lactamase class C family)
VKARLGTVVPLLLTMALTGPTMADAPRRLESGAPAFEREIAAGETHVYEIALKSRRFVLFTVDQRGIDVVVRVYRPDGERIGIFDSPNGARGPEHVSVTGEDKGLYRVEVTPLLESAEPGRYAIVIEQIAPVAKTREGRIDQLFARWDRSDAPGFSLAVARAGEIVFERGYGSAQLEYGIPITPSTIFHVASVSKQFTAFAVAMLAEQGRLSLDDDVREYIPEVPDFGTTITLRHLIHHMSGLRDQWNLLALGGWRLDDVITTEQILTAVSHQEELNFDPGDEYVYCNTGYTLLAEVVARVTGQSFPEWTAENLFEPLGMTRTHFHDDHERIVPGRAYSYAADGAGYRKSVLSYANAGATSLFTTVGDLLKWTHNLETGKVGGAAVIARVHERGVLNSGEELDYAFGLVHGEHNGIETVGHGGGDAGFRTMITRYPEYGLAVATFGNFAGFDSGRVARQVAEIFLADEMAVQARKAPPEPAVDEDGPRAETGVAEISPEVLDAYVGRFQIEEIGLLLTFEREGGQLMAQATGRPRIALVTESENTFHALETGARVTFHRGESGEVGRLTLAVGGTEFEGRRVEPFEPGAGDLVEFAGNYYSPELATFYEIAIDGGDLVARHRRHGTIALRPAVTDEFSGSAWYLGTVRFVRDDDGAVVEMLVSSGRVRNVRFERQVD